MELFCAISVALGLVQGSSVHLACTWWMHEAQDPWLLCCFLASSSWFTSGVVKWSSLPLQHVRAWPWELHWSSRA